MSDTGDTGELGIDFGTAGSVAQAIGAQAVDRGNVTREEVIAFLTADDGTFESDLWDVLGPFIDRIEDDILSAAEMEAAEVEVKAMLGVEELQ